MITKEREGLGNQPHAFKTLRLVVPERANGIGLQVTEGLLFVSPNVEGFRYCPCHNRFGPLTYSVGKEVIAHHLHKKKDDYDAGKTDGGIYFLENENTDSPTFQYQQLKGWIAFLEPQGRRFYSRAESVMVTKITAICWAEECTKELKEGFLVNYDGVLHPICDPALHKFEDGLIQFDFRITEDGQVVFSQI